MKEIEEVEEELKNLPQIITPRELESSLGIPYSTQNHMRRKKLIPYTKIGGKVIYRKEDISKWLLDNTYSCCNKE